MKCWAIALVLLMSAALSGEVFETQGRAQTDWYSRGIIRQQTINGMTPKQKNRKYRNRKKRKAHSTTHRSTPKSKNVAKS
jgi:hypothetical protein